MVLGGTCRKPKNNAIINKMILTIFLKVPCTLYTLYLPEIEPLPGPFLRAPYRRKMGAYFTYFNVPRRAPKVGLKLVVFLSRSDAGNKSPSEIALIELEGADRSLGSPGGAI